MLKPLPVARERNLTLRYTLMTERWATRCHGIASATLLTSVFRVCPFAFREIFNNNLWKGVAFVAGHENQVWRSMTKPVTKCTDKNRRTRREHGSRTRKGRRARVAGRRGGQEKLRASHALGAASAGWALMQGVSSLLGGGSSGLSQSRSDELWEGLSPWISSSPSTSTSQSTGLAGEHQRHGAS